MDYWYNSSSGNTVNFACDATGTTDFHGVDIGPTNLTLSTPDPLIDWLPNSCLYTKYVPTWHLVRSYR